MDKEECEKQLREKADASSLQDMQRQLAELKDLMDSKVKHLFSDLISKYMAGAPQLSDDEDDNNDKNNNSKIDNETVEMLQDQINQLYNLLNKSKENENNNNNNNGNNINLSGNEDVGELLNTMKIMENRLEDLEGYIRDGKEREETFLQRWNDLKALCDELVSENDTLKEKNKNLQKRVEKLEGSITGVNDEVAKRLKDALDALQLNDEFQDKTDAKLSNLQRELNNQRKYQKEQFEAVDDKLNEIKNAVKLLEENQSTLVTQCNDEFGNVKTELGVLQSQISELKDPLEIEIRNLRAECNSLLEELQRQQAQHRQTLNDYIAILEDKKQSTIQDYRESNSRSRAILTQKELEQSPAVLVENIRLKQDNILLRANIYTSKKGTPNDELRSTCSSRSGYTSNKSSHKRIGTAPTPTRKINTLLPNISLGT